MDGPKRTAAGTGGQRPALGRGLAALLPTAPERSLVQLRLDEIRPERDQPRQDWNETALKELAASIRAKGILQPLLVRRAAEGGYRLIAGERRWRAAKEAGLATVPAVVRDTTAAEAFELALIENIQRQDLNPVEEAGAYQRLLSEHGLTQEELSKRIGKERPTIANSLRLLKLPDPVRASVACGDLSTGHAKVLLGLDDAGAIIRTAGRVLQNDLSVRETERLVDAQKQGRTKRRKPRPATAPAELVGLAANIEHALGRPCDVRPKGRDGGEVVFPFGTPALGREVLEELLAALALLREHGRRPAAKESR